MKMKGFANFFASQVRNYGLKIAISRINKPYRTLNQFGTFDGCQHWSGSYKEALEWAACYPSDSPVFIFRFDECIGYRFGSQD